MLCAAEMTSADPFTRVEAAQYAGRWFFNDLDRASQALKLAVRMLPTICPRTLTRMEQQRKLSRFFGLASLAASASLESGDMPYQALRNR